MSLTEEELEEMALKSAMNMGAARDIWHPGYGWILKDGQITEIGERFLKELHSKENP
jgi:hypothetical protein